LETSIPISPFDFEEHRRRAVEEYARKRGQYLDFAHTVQQIMHDAIKVKELRVNDIQFRAKEVDSYGEKVMTPSEQKPEEPKYKNPLLDITDIAGVRVITFFPRTVIEVCKCIEEEFEVIEKVDHTAASQKEERLGYQSIHYLVKLSSKRTNLAEYRRFGGLIAEIQARTVMQHAWAEIEHDIRYKSASVIPLEISRRFMTLAGLLEIADREFEAIQDQDRELRKDARKKIEAGDWGTVEITPDALRSYLSLTIGSDDRISEFSYEWEARLLKNLGFKNIRQIDECVKGYNDDQLSRIVWGTRSGQLSRFDLMLLAAMGDYFIDNHAWKDLEWYRPSEQARLRKLQENGVQIGSYRPQQPGGPETRL
jgi:putative GTP pyrophosphokinase